MPIKEVSSERNFQYESPDGEVYNIKIVSMSERKYVQFCLDGSGKEPITIDGPMLADMFYEYQDCTSARPQPGRRHGCALKAPRVVDHRQQADLEIPSPASMENEPEPDINAPEIDVEDLPEVGETPQEWSLQEDKKNMPSWKQDAMARKSVPRPVFERRGSAGSGFQRMGSGELI